MRVNHLGHFCQMKSSRKGQVFYLGFMFLFILGACSKQHIVKKEDELKKYRVQVSAGWFEDESGTEKTPINWFFDPSPDASAEDFRLNFIPLVFKGSKYHYDIDIPSGKLYYSHAYCPQKDVWNNYSGTLESPPYTLGFIPRMLDQSGKPLRILVFGNEHLNKPGAYRTQVLGGFVVETCRGNSCEKSTGWVKRTVLVGTNLLDKRYRRVKTLQDLKKKHNWAEVKAFLENAEGVRYAFGENAPSSQVKGELNRLQAAQALGDLTHIFTPNEMKKIQTSCQRLYEYFSSRLLNREKGFAGTFLELREKYAERFHRCSELVKMSWHSQDAKRHWLLAYISGFFALEDLGFSYSCDRQRWVKGKNQLGHCEDDVLLKAFEQLPLGFKKLYARGQISYRYIDFDFGTRGTHAKVDSWVEYSNQKLNCLSPKSEPKKSFLPDDAVWPFAQIK